GLQLKIRDEVLQEDFTVRAKHMVGALGPWTDAAGTRLHGGWKPVLRPTKGVHLTFSRERFPLPCAVVMAVEDRIVFAIPRHEMVIVGTTDTDEARLPEEVHVQTEDVKYLLGVTAKYFPQAKLTSRDVVSCYVGVRPLVRDEAGSAGKTSREHQIWTLDQATYVCGGKYTTYRRMSQQVVAAALKHFPFEEQARFANSHSRQALNPRITREAYRRRFEIQEELRSSFSDTETMVEVFLDRFGHECLDFVKKYPGARSVAAIEAEIAIDTSSCRHLKDFFFRRVPWVLSRPDHGLAFLDDVAEVFRRRFGWNSQQLDKEIAEYRIQLEQEHRVLSLY
ncbi:MAG: FAD-dependent oxidoreductase, partial [Bdellovibrio sp.]